MNREAVILVVGGGVAGLSCALAAARECHVELMLPEPLRAAGEGAGAAGAGANTLGGGLGGNTQLAQGGIAAAIAPGDSVSDHLADTIAAGAGLVDEAAALTLVSDGAGAVKELIARGFAVDRGPDGLIHFGLEAAHGRSRIVHAGGDRTGAALHETLVASVLAEVSAGRISISEGAFVEELICDSGSVVGAVLEGADGFRESRRADAVVLATGGYAGLYSRTSNRQGARGAGIVLAAQVGAVISDLEFVQFHPTVFGGESGCGALISEAVRGAGARLLDGSGTPFMDALHPLGDLAPRDVVSREIHRLLRRRGGATVWLDATVIERERGAGALARRFPGITELTAARGIDWTREPIPVSPAAHYSMGGVASDLDGRSSVPGLFAAGETASSGVHGANRLASNSLLEGLVFGARAGRAAAGYAGTVAGQREWRPRGSGFVELAREAETVELGGEREKVAGVDPPADLHARGAGAPTVAGAHSVPAALTEWLGIERDERGLRDAARVCDAAASVAGQAAALAAMMCVAATARTESRGAHQRADYPGVDHTQASRRGYRFVFASAAAPARDSVSDPAGSAPGSVPGSAAAAVSVSVLS